MDLKRFWAKTEPFQSVYTHSLISGRVAQHLLSSYMSGGCRKLLSDALETDIDLLSAYVGYMVSLHDIGKLEYSFQSLGKQSVPSVPIAPELEAFFVPGIRHEKTGQQCLRSLWKERGADRNSGMLISKIIGSHHQGKTGGGNFKPSSGWYAVQKELEAEMRKTFLPEDASPLPRICKENQGAASALLLGLLILSDWISSGDTFADAETWIDHNDSQDRIAFGIDDFIRKSGLAPQQTAWPDSFCGLWPNIPTDGLRPLQREIETLMNQQDDPPLLVLIEAPMGEGKTEAGIFAATQMARRWGKDGLYFALPTAATANQMIGRVQAFLDMHDLAAPVRLLHSMAWLETSAWNRVNSPDERDEAAAWLSPVKRGLLGQYAVGTVDQAMFAATNVKYGVLRLLGLSNKALIIDEIHSYDAYMGEIIVRLLEWCKALEIPVVMLSATLPSALKEKLLAPYTSEKLSGAYPLITAIGKHGDVIEHVVPGTSHALDVSIQLDQILGDKEQIAKAAIDGVKDGGCLCVLMNTVKEAQEVYSSIKTRYDGDLMLFHAQFPAGQRSAIEAECVRKYGKDKTQRPSRSILVATQVVEQSLDVDFDRMLTAVAPVDLLLQRMGRIYRHEETPRPSDCAGALMTVLCPKAGTGFGASAYVYPECLLNGSLRVLQNVRSIRIPDDLSKLVRDAYSPEFAPPQESEQWMKKLLKDDLDAGASQRYLLNQPNKLFSALEGFAIFEDDGDSFELSAKTRLGEPSVRVALLPPEEMEALKPFLKEKNGRKSAAVWDQKTAERVMKQSVSVRIRRLGEDLSVLSYINGDSLLSGTKIFGTQDGVCRLENGHSLRFDPELGLQIKEGGS